MDFLVSKSGAVKINKIILSDRLITFSMSNHQIKSHVTWSEDHFGPLS